MAKNIDPKLSKIGEYLKLSEDAVFVIPEYQRAYSWGTDRCDKLWSDIIDYSENDAKDAYFFGTVILNCQNDDRELLLIDGQQRTTTFFLLLKAFLLRINTSINNAKGDEDSQKLINALNDRRKEIMSILYRLDSDDVDDRPEEEVYKTSKSLLDNKSIREQFKEDFDAIIRASSFDEAEKNVTKIKYRQKDNRYSNFFRNFKFFYEKIGEFSSDSRLNTVTKILLKSCELIEIKSWNLEQAITMFNSLNSDSLPLNDADIISSKLYECAKHDSQEIAFTKKWEEFHANTQTLEEKNIGNIDSILMQYMYYIRTRRGETTSDTGALIIATPGLRRYFTDINKESLTRPIDFSNDVIRLTKIWEKLYDYPCIQALLKFNENARLFLASYLLRFDEDSVTEEHIITMAESLMKLFTIMEVEETGFSSRYFKSFLFEEEIKMTDPAIPVDIIRSDFYNHISSNWDRSDIKQKIFEYDKHMLVYLNEYLYAKENGMNFDLKGKYDIEHIMPVSGKNLQTIRADAGIDNEEMFKNMVNKLGNKIILEYAINRSIGNEWFRTKISNTLENKMGYVNSKYPLAKMLVDKYKDSSEKYWTRENILDATEKSSERIVDFVFSK